MAENPNNRLQKFNGSKSAIRPESWIKLYDFENNSLKEDEKIKNLMYYLTDSALEWYADEIISNPAIKRWEVVKEKLIQRFGSYNANPIVSASHRRLKREESIENYFQDKIRLLNQTHLTKEEKIHLLTDGLPNDWKDLIVAAQPTDTTKWFHIAASIEQNRASIQFKPKNKIHLATKNNDNRKNVCPFWCPICSKKGIKIKHWVTDCEDYDPNYKKDRPNQNTSVKQVCGAPELLNVSTLTNTPTQGAFKLINISVEVNGIPAQAFVDTGATVSIINWRLFKRTRLQLQPNSDIHISQADGVTRTCGSLQTKVRIDKLIKPVTLHVMKNFKYPLLIGLDVASLFNLLIDVRDKTIYTKIDGLQNPILVNHLEEIREHELKELLEHNRNVFSQHAIDLGKVAIQHKIITKSEQPISLRPYRRPLKEYEEIAEQVKELLEHKLIRISDSPWAFPVVMVPKKDGNKRMCIDYRRLNEITLDDRQPLPHIQDMFDRLHGSRFFSTLDVAWGYWQIEMDPQSIQKTAFVTNDGHYEFLVMPFGLKNAASTFQRIIKHILGELLWKGTCSFQDDILVYTKTWQEHIELLSNVFYKLRQYNMKLKVSKCIFGRTEVKYLGHIISHNQLKPDPGKVKSIQDFPRPDTVKKVRQFMGLANYYRKFVKDFSKISFPLVRLTRKNQPFIWNEEVEESFAKLKMALSTKPVLAIYNPDYPSKVYTDASKYGIGAILTQIGPDNEEHVIAYYSKTLQPHQENYSAYEMECLAVIQATDHFHVYIENQPFEIITDHAALQWLFTMKKPKPKYFRWILSLSSKSCNIVHRSGKQQTHVDALSRLPVVNIATQELQEHQQNSDLSFLKNSHAHDGVVMIKQKGVFKAVVPNSLTKKILEEYHDSLSHPSITKTCKLITQCYWWKGITTDIKNYVRSCKSCQLVKVRHEPTLGEMITPTSNIQPLQMIGCDTIVLGTAAANTKHKFIQVFVDHATRYLWAYPTITNTAQAVTQCLDKIIKSVNSINTILTDNGKNFISKEFNKFLSLQGIKHTYTSPYHPQCNGICEKLNDTIMTKLRIAVLEKPRCKWSSLLPQVVKNYNSTPHDVTGFSPLFLMYGIGNVPEFADQTPITIEEARKKASLRTEQIRKGDLVIRKIAFNDPRLIKTSPKYEGPFVIQKKISDVTYDISLKDQKQARRIGQIWEEMQVQLRDVGCTKTRLGLYHCVRTLATLHLGPTMGALLGAPLPLNLPHQECWHLLAKEPDLGSNILNFLLDQLVDNPLCEAGLRGSPTVTQHPFMSLAALTEMFRVAETEQYACANFDKIFSTLLMTLGAYISAAPPQSPPGSPERRPLRLHPPSQHIKGMMHSPYTERPLFGPSRPPLWSGSMGSTNQPTGVYESSWSGCCPSPPIRTWLNPSYTPIGLPLFGPRTLSSQYSLNLPTNQGHLRYEVDTGNRVEVGGWYYCVYPLVFHGAFGKDAPNGVYKGQCVVEAMKAFLLCAQEEKLVYHLAEAGYWISMEEEDSFHLGISALAQAVCQYCPKRVARLFGSMRPQSCRLGSQKVAVVAFMSELLSAEFPGKSELVEPLVSSLQGQLDSPCRLVRKLAIHGLGHVSGLSKFQKYSTTVISAMMSGLDDRDDPDHDISLEAMAGLSNILEQLDCPGPDLDTVKVVVCLHVCCFFDKDKPEVREAAFRLLGRLAKLEAESTTRNEESSSSFAEEVHKALVMVLVHLNDENPAVSEVCKTTLLQLSAHLRQEEVVIILRKFLQEDTHFHYEEFLNSFSRLLVLMFLDKVSYYIPTAINYLNSPRPQLQCNAVLLLGYLLGNIPPESHSVVEKEKVCG
ncbi:K02A2.6-like, partial [Cordylochernes scorpioides]